ncbi:MAG: hypothetical protein ACD_79C00341G0003 [uncultured bacterium]|nr:MAG: hypothetical protein ACD_79C00341G0003 [uncultured bacterium]OGU16729.1 MAG: hypothetical protein A2076_06850 [Geobacteraceae bacterium GWC2_53_11]
MDEGCFPATKAVIESFHDSRIRHVVNINQQGLAKKITKGTNLFPDDVNWCTIVCDDDYIAPDFIEIMLTSVIKRGITNILHSRITFVDKCYQVIRVGQNAPAEESALDFVSARADFKRDRYLTGILFSREQFNKIGGYPQFTTGMAADDALIFALAIQDKLYFESNAMAFICIHDEAESNQVIGIDKHFDAIVEYGLYCKNILDTYAGSNLAADQIDRHVVALNQHFWINAYNSVRKNPELHYYEAALFKVGIKPNIEFPIRIRLSSLLGLYLFCPEKIGVYRSVWKRIEKSRHLQRYSNLLNIFYKTWRLGAK